MHVRHPYLGLGRHFPNGDAHLFAYIQRVRIRYFKTGILSVEFKCGLELIVEHSDSMHLGNAGSASLAGEFLSAFRRSLAKSQIRTTFTIIRFPLIGSATASFSGKSGLRRRIVTLKLSLYTLFLLSLLSELFRCNVDSLC